MDPSNVPLIDGVDPSNPELAQTLKLAGLPTEDLAEPGRQFFRFSDAAGALIGFIGWERAGEAALLRSLVVVPARRRRGWSRVMTNWALEQLRARGIADAYALTASIEPLARKLGFSRIDREQAPPEIRDSRQFASLCPATAVLMHQHLD